MHDLKPPKIYKIVLGATEEDLRKLLRLKAQLGESFYVRKDSKLTNFTVGILDKDLTKLSDDFRGLVQPMLDEGVGRHCCSMLFRFLNEKYIDEFLTTGRFRLSTFAGCQKLENMQRRDCNEGTCGLFVNGGKAASALVGANAFLTCASLSPLANNPEGHKSAILIKDVEWFNREVTEGLRQLGYKVDAVLQGPCVYTNHCFALGEMPDQKTDESLRKILDALGDRLYFMKDGWYIKEHEYRLLWLTSSTLEDDHAFVTLKSPNVYCEKVVLPENVKGGVLG